MKRLYKILDEASDWKSHWRRNLKKKVNITIIIYKLNTSTSTSTRTMFSFHKFGLTLTLLIMGGAVQRNYEMDKNKLEYRCWVFIQVYVDKGSRKELLRGGGGKGLATKKNSPKNVANRLEREIRPWLFFAASLNIPGSSSNGSNNEIYLSKNADQKLNGIYRIRKFK